MAKASPKELGEKPIGSLLIKQAIPASIGILAMSLNIKGVFQSVSPKSPYILGVLKV